MKRIFVDMWAWYAMTDRTDTDHVIAQLANEELLDNGYTFVTTNYLVAETVPLIRYHVGHTPAVQFGQVLRQLQAAGLVEVIRLSEIDEEAAWRIFEKYVDQAFSYVDCTSFAVMQFLGLTEGFTADSHFATFGFTRIPT